MISANAARFAVALVMCITLIASPSSAQSTASSWPDPIAHHVMPYHTSGLTHGPMLGRPTATSVRVWVRTSQPASFKVVYSETLPLRISSKGDQQSPHVVGKTVASKDNTGVVELTGLKPNTRYYYGIVTATGLIDTRMEFDRPWPSFRTLPDATSYKDALNNPEGRFNFAFSIGCCARQKSPVDSEKFGIYGNPPSFGTMYRNHRDDVAFHIVNGDFIYEETLDGTREGFDANYRLYLSRGRNMSNYFRYVPLVAMFNDHEMNSNLDGAGEVGLKDGNYLKRDYSQLSWIDYAGWSADPAPHKGRIHFGKAAATQGKNILFDENADFTSLKSEQVSTIHVGPYMQGDGQTKKDRGGANIGVYGLKKVLDKNRLQVTPAFRASGNIPYSIGTHHYYDRKIGNTHFFYLDTRSERSKFYGEKRAHDEDRFILGDTQRKWFLDGVSKSTSDFIVVVSPDPWVIYHSGYHVKPERGTGSKGDGFCGYVHERELVLNELDKIEKPILIFTGDVHNSFAVQMTDNVWEFMVGPLNSAGHPIGTAGLPPFGGWFDSEGRKVKVKWVAGFPDNVHYSRQRNTYYAVVKFNNIMQAAKPQGIGYQYVAYDEPQVVVQFFDGYTGKLVYAEGISTADSKSDQTPKPKISRWPIEKE